MHFSVVIHLSKYRFRPKFSEETFSTIHGDAFTEQYDKKVKKQLNPINQNTSLVKIQLINGI